ncbi:MAG TPA: ATP-dependent DNA ligase, partial [Candidatus Methanoperedens sp.]
MTSFEEFFEVCKKIESISASLEITSIVAEFLKKVDDGELKIATHFIMGRVFPVWSEKELGIGPSLLYSAISRASYLPVKRIEDFVKDTGDIGLAAEKAMASGKTHAGLFSEGELTLTDVYSRFMKISQLTGKGSQEAKIKNLQYLIASAKSAETVYLARLSIEELRIGVGEGIVRDAIALAFNVPQELVERAYMLTNDFGVVAYTAKKEGREGLLKLDIILGRPLKMMLAQVTPGIKEAIEEIGTVAVEWKFDGARVQIHKDGDSVTIYSRRIENVTSSLPDIVKSVKSNVTAANAILDGETVALGKDMRPMAFQEILRRFRRKYDVSTTALEIPLYLNIFDILYLNGKSLIDYPLDHRRKNLEMVCHKSIVARQTVTDNIPVIEAIYREALAAGHEGVMLKNPGSPYTPGKRGK